MSDLHVSDRCNPQVYAHSCFGAQNDNESGEIANQRKVCFKSGVALFIKIFALCAFLHPMVAVFLLFVLSRVEVIAQIDNN